MTSVHENEAHGNISAWESCTRVPPTWAKYTRVKKQPETEIRGRSCIIRIRGYYAVVSSEQLSPVMPTNPVARRVVLQADAPAVARTD